MLNKAINYYNGALITVYNRIATLKAKVICCYNLAKQLSHYLYLLFFWDILYRKECGKVSHHRCHSHMNRKVI